MSTFSLWKEGGLDEDVLPRPVKKLESSGEQFLEYLVNRLDTFLTSPEERIIK